MAAKTLKPKTVAVEFELLTSKQHRFVRSGILPCVPTKGMMVDAGDGNYREVRKVYLKHDAILIWVEHLDDAPAALKKYGWRPEP